MKKLLYMASFLALVFTSCDPMEDAYKEVDEANADAVADAKFFSDKVLLETGYTLTDADYALSSNSSVSGHMNFSSSATAADNLPEVLTNMKVYGEAGSEYTINYNFYRGSLSYVGEYLDYLEVLAAIDSYTLTTADYDSMGTAAGEPGKYNNFDATVKASDYLPNFLLTKYPDAADGYELAVTYKYYNGSSTSMVTEFWAFDGSVWTKSDKVAPAIPGDVMIYELTTADYDEMGTGSNQPGKYNNFSSSIVPADYLPNFLSFKFPFALEGNKITPIYKYYAGDGVTETKAVEYTLTKGVWVAYQSTVEASSLVAYKDKTWLFVPPIKFVKSEKAPTVTFTLVYEDYAFVGNSQYGNFDEEEAVVLEKIAKIIKNNYEVAVGQVYSVTYKYYNAGVTDKTVILEAVEDI
ncbi:hypothetical protein GQR60_14260 [Labilibaculum sp. A4]|uniref:hypothetical protein n=1 Tax=Labilibaculum euxinus TaxID=2686357 RepID=UPI000F6214F8|nr:hypothetical protein [Labilibaculum euxinus]MDQ1770079.1 hypothetical protein [Labilibaculum euxinus]MWN77500.1 hypothetical protein [Labilibaculum euxinus]